MTKDQEDINDDIEFDDLEDLEDIDLDDDDLDDDDLDEDVDDTELDEEKEASMGDVSSIPDPHSTGSSKRSQDNKQGDKSAPLQGSSMKTKTSMITDVMSKLHGMGKKDLSAAYKTIMGPATGENVIMQGSSKIKESLHVTTDDIDITEDVRALFHGSEDLSEEFKTKASTIFETTLVSKINEHLEFIAEKAELLYEEQALEIEEELIEKLNNYLDYVVEGWMDNNILAIENGIRSEIAEDFMKGLHSLFVENYINVPENKIDVLENLSTKVDELEEKLNEEMNKNISLKEENNILISELIIDELSEDLTLTDSEKLRKLSLNVEFINEENFREKVEMIKESYFHDNNSDDDKKNKYDMNDDEPLNEEVHVPVNMARYMNAISRTSAKK